MPRLRSARVEARFRWLTAGLLALLTLGLRAVNLTQSYDIHVDEVIYQGISQNLADHGRLELFGGPFYLHPPAFFLWEAAYIRLIHPQGDVIHQVFAVRPINLAFAAFTAALLFLIAQRVVGWRAGLAAAGIFALDPFVIRMNSVNLLDTSAIMWVLLGHFLALRMAGGDGAGRAWLTPATGIAYGLALLTKDMMAPLTLLPLAICFALDWALPRRASVLVGATALATYSLYPITIAAMGDWHDFQEQKLHGLERFVGLVQETGFKQSGGPSLIQAIVSNLDQYATTYALIGSGLAAICILLLVGHQKARLLGIWTGSAYALLAYSLAHGTLEEQFFYFLVVPSILGTSSAALLLVHLQTGKGALLAPVVPVFLGWSQLMVGGLYARFLRAWQRLRRPGIVLFAALGVAFLAWSGSVWARVHTTPDNGYERLAAFFAEVAPDRNRVAVASQSAAIILTDYVKGKVFDPEDFESGGSEYLELSTKNVENHYGEPSPEFYDWIVRRGEVAFAFRGRSYGILAVYRFPNGP